MFAVHHQQDMNINIRAAGHCQIRPFSFHAELQTESSLRCIVFEWNAGYLKNIPLYSEGADTTKFTPLHFSYIVQTIRINEEYL